MADLIEDEDGAPYPEGVQAIARERGRQITELGFTPEHDERHFVMDLVGPAISLLGGRNPWRTSFTVKRTTPDSGYFQRDDLVRAGALIAAAIDRLDNTKD